MNDADLRELVRHHEYVVAVPSDPATSTIAAASGVVVYEVHRGGEAANLMADYEGNLYGASNLARYAARVSHAYDRAVRRYPTIARQRINDPATFTAVGRLDLGNGRIELFAGASETLAEWLGHTPTDADLVWQPPSTQGFRSRMTAAANEPATPLDLDDL